MLQLRIFFFFAKMLRLLYTLALNVLMSKYTCKDIRESSENEVQQIRRQMLNNSKFKVNYRTYHCQNQLHFHTDSPAVILDEIINGEEIYDIGMSDIEF